MSAEIILSNADPEFDARLQKFVRRAPSIRSQAHLDKIILSFAPEQRAFVIGKTSGMLHRELVAREPEEVQVKPKDEANPTATEDTVMRLNAHAAKILEQADTLAEMRKQIKDLTTENKSLKELLDEKVKG